MLHILRQIETISACRDRELLAATIVAGIKESFPAVQAVSLLRGNAGHCTLIARSDESGLQLVSGDSADDMLQIAIAPELRDGLQSNRASCQKIADQWHCALPIDTTAASGHGILLLELTQELDAESHEALERFTRFYANYIRLLDYSEKDTLTQLFNRKTFDESFDRLLAQAESATLPDHLPQERRNAVKKTPHPHWIAVADIDHFKRVNDSFGHLFGDEVLIRFAGIMKKTFRTSDRLFRFGGEEFVILLKPTSETNARRVLDRFRKNVEAYEFPQVGKVSCSLGYAMIRPTSAPTDIIGQADQALYFSKENGRNQVNGYEDLVARSLLTPTTTPEAIQPDDIDALFG